jgi:hypothetical protein
MIKAHLALAAVLTLAGCAHSLPIVTRSPSYDLASYPNSQVSNEVKRFNQNMQKMYFLRNRQARDYDDLSRATSFWNISNSLVTIGGVSAGQVAGWLGLGQSVQNASGAVVALGGLSIFIMELDGIKSRLADAREAYLGTKLAIQEADLKFTTLSDSLTESNPEALRAALRELKTLNAKLEQILELGDY